MDKRTEGREEKRINAQTGKGIPERWLLLAAADAAMPHLSLASNSIRVAGFGYSISLLPSLLPAVDADCSRLFPPFPATNGAQTTTQLWVGWELWAGGRLWEIDDLTRHFWH